MRTKSTGKKPIRVVTLGCSKNLYDSEVLMGQLRANRIDAAHEEQAENPGIVVINTCGFIHDAKQESIDTILEYLKLKSEGIVEKVYVTGCLSERYREELKKEIPEADAYFGTHDLPLLLKALGADYKSELVGERLLTTPRHYAYLKISEGCDRTCSFCAIPGIRGKHRSTPVEKLLEEARNLAAQGVKELILIAQDLTYYGLDLYRERRLPQLLEALTEIDGIEWIRLHYAYPANFPDALIQVMKEHPKICRYLDIPFQHINTDILHSMRRGHGRETIETLIRKLRSELPGIALRTTLITGYPGETREQFEELKEWVRRMRFDRLGVFPYSHEENTRAARLEDDVPEEEKQRRVAEIMSLQAEISYELNREKIGKVFDCIFDRIEGDYYTGRTQYDSPDVDNEVLVPAGKYHISPGRIIRIRITGAGTYDLSGEPV